MTADKPLLDATDVPDEICEEATGRWEWVPTQPAPRSTPPERNDLQAPAGGGAHNDHPRTAESPQLGPRLACVFGHPIAQSNIRSQHHPMSSQMIPGVASGGREAVETNHARISPHPDAVARTPLVTGASVCVESPTTAIGRPSPVTLGNIAPSGTTPRAVHHSSQVLQDPALLAAMLASISVSPVVDPPHDSLPSTLSSRPDPPHDSPPSTLSSQPDPPKQPATVDPSVDQLLYYHREPVVPIPAGMVPLPPLPSSERPIEPETSFSPSQPTRHYMSYVSTLPGLDFMPWNVWRPRIESHRGFPKPYRPEFRAPESREQARRWWSDKLSDSSRRESPVRVLPPPPRPQVVVQGPHWWVVYVGRAPGIYTTAEDVIAQTRGFPNAQAEIFSDEDAARRWYWYARAQGFLVPRFGPSV